MAPFNTHFLVAEKVWPTVTSTSTWPKPYSPTLYGQFCFGCVAPDVDKASTTLSQKDTHFFDRYGHYTLMASHRSATFLQRQAEFLRAPFAQLAPEAQAFVLGYLCHLCVDEVSKHMWQRETWKHFFDIGPGPAFAALDEVARDQTQDYGAIVTGFAAVAVLDIIPSIPHADLKLTLQGTRKFVEADSVEDEFLALVDMFDRPSPEVRCQKLEDLRANIHTARDRSHWFKLDVLVQASIHRTQQRFHDLMTGQVPQPGYPLLP
ncbi:MAG: zinc dependent phospholipase C family protein [Anaerolineae bacterium]|nr:zinc dependent phospholipase C family protein [Anaerolineae bacterium]